MPFDPKRFDPKLVEQAEAPLTDSGDLSLPDDLQELAAQLGDDAKYLARLYPAHSGHLAPRDASITADGSSTREDAFPLAEREGHYASTSQSIGLLSAVPAVAVEEDAAPAAAFRTHIRRTSRRLLRAVALVASLAALAAGATLWYPRGENDPQPRNIASSPERSTTEVSHIASNNDATDNTPSPAPALASPPAPAPPAPATRETFLHEYSGPELEGIYDLIGDSEDDKISI